MEYFTYPAGDRRGKDMFFRLEQKMKIAEFDDEFLQNLIEYKKIYPATERFDLFYAMYAAHYGKYDLAWEYAQKAYARRKLDREVLKLLVDLANRRGLWRQAAFWLGLANKFYQVPVHLNIARDKLPEYLLMLTQAWGLGNYAPFVAEFAYFDDGVTKRRSKTIAGDYIPALKEVGGDYRYFVGVYADEENLQAKGWLLDKLADDETFTKHCGADFEFDIMRAKTIDGNFSVEPQGEVILPVAATEKDQLVRFSASDIDEDIFVGKWQFGYFRLDRPTTVSSDQKFVVGEPIFLKHNPRRRKIVLNILIDALSWGEEKRANFAHVPNMTEFFGKNGVIFDNHYAVAEFTFPAFAAIESGMYPHKSQIFNEYARTELDTEYMTISEQMKNLGYYCVNVMGGGHGIYNGTSRGYRRLITSSYALHMYDGVERTIRQLEAFGECDQFLFVHVGDAHPWSVSDYQVSVKAQTRSNLYNRVHGAKLKKASVYLPNAYIYQQGNRCGMENADRSLKVLLDYLSAHYSPEEYNVMVYSDHGVPVYDEEQYLFSEMQNNAVLMLCGHGVPRVGHVDELVSSLDIYPIMAHLHDFAPPAYLDGNLPRIFGGKERDYVIANSIYPEQTYRLAIRTKKYECQLESVELVQTDGTVNLDGAKVRIFTRDEAHLPVADENIRQYFLTFIKEHTGRINNEGQIWT